MIHRPSPLRGGAHMWLSYSPDMRHWGDHKLLIEARDGAWWDAGKIGLGPRRSDAPGLAGDVPRCRVTSDGPIYQVGLALLDLEDPGLLLHRTDMGIRARCAVRDHRRRRSCRLSVRLGRSGERPTASTTAHGPCHRPGDGFVQQGHRAGLRRAAGCAAPRPTGRRTSPSTSRPYRRLFRIPFVVGRSSGLPWRSPGDDVEDAPLAPRIEPLDRVLLAIYGSLDRVHARCDQGRGRAWTDGQAGLKAVREQRWVGIRQERAVRWMANLVILTIDDLVLRPWRLADAPEVLAVCRDPEIARWVTIPQPFLSADADAFIQNALTMWRDGTGAAFAIVDAATDRLLGAVTRFGPDGHQATFGLWLAPNARSRGWFPVLRWWRTGRSPRPRPSASTRSSWSATRRQIGWWSGPGSGVRACSAPGTCITIASVDCVVHSRIRRLIGHIHALADGGPALTNATNCSSVSPGIEHEND